VQDTDVLQETGDSEIVLFPLNRSEFPNFSRTARRGIGKDRAHPYSFVGISEYIIVYTCDKEAQNSLQYTEYVLDRLIS